MLPVRGASADPPVTTQNASGSDLRTVSTAIKATITPPEAQPTEPTAAQTGYMGVSLMAKPSKAIVVEYVDPLSPAYRAGIRVGEVILRINDTEATAGISALRETLLGCSVGNIIKVVVRRQNKPYTLAVQLAPRSQPRKLSGQRAVLGAVFRESPDGEGLLLDRVVRDSPADKAGLQAGDILLGLDQEPVIPTASMNDLLAPYSPDDMVNVRYRRAGKTDTVRLKLEGEVQPSTDINSFRRANLFKKDVFKLAVIGIEYPDVKHNSQIGAQDWENSFFSTGTYKDKNATGQTTYGSLNDYYQEVSCGKLRVEGKAFPWITADKNRLDYAPGSGDRRLLNEALSKVIARDGKDALEGYDGVMFIYAGTRASVNRGNLYWPHRSSVTFGGKRWSYFICPEGGQRMTNISVFCHEFGHMLGLPDLYARPENPGSEGLGQWCLMSNQLNQGRPQHPSPWCKEQLGWLSPTVIDPRVKQKLVLSPIEKTTNECFKILARPDGSEYFLVEVRKKMDFDTDLPGEGLLVWRVVRGRPILEESHGIEGPLGPRSFLGVVPFPSASNQAFTPFTTPSSKPQLGGGYPVYLTDIERLPDGRVSFSIGYETL